MGNYGSSFCPRLNRLGVTSQLIVTGVIGTRHLAAGAVTNAKVPDGGLTLGTAKSGSTCGKLDAAYVEFSTAASNTQVTVAHGLGRAPVGMEVVMQDKPGVLYRGTAAAFTATNMWVKTNMGTVVFTLRVF